MNVIIIFLDFLCCREHTVLSGFGSEIRWTVAMHLCIFNALLFAIRSVCDFAPHHSQSGGAFSQRMNNSCR